VFSFRPIVQSDKPAIQAIASQTWEGSDYLPFVFDDWVADPQGEFVAVLLDGRLAGCGKMTFLTPTDVWFEGLRKDPAVKEKGVATAITARFLALLAGRRDLTSVRFSTYFDNLSSITSNERLGFRRAASLSWKSLSGRSFDLASITLPGFGDGQATGGRVVQIKDERSIRRFMESSPWLGASRGLLPEGWKVFPYSWVLFAERYEAEVILPSVPRVKSYLEARGFRSWEQEEDFLVFEYPIERLMEET
jgi:hypothetical protein